MILVTAEMTLPGPLYQQQQQHRETPCPLSLCCTLLPASLAAPVPPVPPDLLGRGHHRHRHDHHDPLWHHHLTFFIPPPPPLLLLVPFCSFPLSGEEPSTPPPSSTLTHSSQHLSRPSLVKGPHARRPALPTAGKAQVPLKNMSKP